MIIKIVKKQNGKSTKLDKEFSSLDEANNYVIENIVSNDTNKYIYYKYKINKPFIAHVYEYIFLDSNDYFMYSYKIAEVEQ